MQEVDSACWPCAYICIRIDAPQIVNKSFFYQNIVILDIYLLFLRMDKTKRDEHLWYFGHSELKTDPFLANIYMWIMWIRFSSASAYSRIRMAISSYIHWNVVTCSMETYLVSLYSFFAVCQVINQLCIYAGMDTNTGMRSDAISMPMWTLSLTKSLLHIVRMYYIIRLYISIKSQSLDL